MDNIKKEISRRGLIRYLGNAAVFLPFMRTLLETQAFGETARKHAVFYYYPCGFMSSGTVNTFQPAKAGNDFVLPESTKVLEPFRKDIIMTKGISYITRPRPSWDGNAHGPGGNHGLSGCNGNELNTLTIDTKLGEFLRAPIPVVRLGIQSASSGIHNSVSFSSVSQGLNKQPILSVVQDSPFKAFQEIFGSAPTTGGGAPAAGSGELSVNLKKSILDANLEQITALQKKLGSIEKEKLEFNIASIRELERRLQSNVATGPVTAQCTKKLSRTLSESESSFDVIIDLQTEIAIQALACGVTNVVLIQAAHTSGGPAMKNGKPDKLGEGYHAISHFDQGGDAGAAKQAKHTANTAYMMGKFANILKGLKDVSEGDKNLLYNSAVLAFSEIGSSSGHDQKNLGLILAGNAGGALNPGRAIDFTGQGMINSNLLVTIMQSLGMPDTKQGSSDNGKGPIKALLA